MIGRRQPKARKFSYEPRYYDPKKNEKEGKGIKFKRNRSRSAAKLRSIFWLIFLVALILYIILFLGQMIRK